MSYFNGDKYLGKWKNGKREGEGTILYKNGSIGKGFWKEDKLL